MLWFRVVICLCSYVLRILSIRVFDALQFMMTHICMSAIRINYFIGDLDLIRDIDYDRTCSNKQNTTLAPMKLNRKPITKHEPLHFSCLLCAPVVFAAIVVFIERLSIGEDIVIKQVNTQFFSHSQLVIAFVFSQKIIQNYVSDDNSQRIAISLPTYLTLHELN